MKADLILHNVTIATMVDGSYGLVPDGGVVIHEGQILWAGPYTDMPAVAARVTLDGQGRLLTPGLIDCHTHIVYAGHRAGEFAQRLQGVSYEEIARRGGGIMSTVRATREATTTELVAAATPRIVHLLREGVTTLEVKTGYGLDLASEMKMIDAMTLLEAALPIDIYRTFLGAHTLPPEYRDNSEGYVDLICDQMIPQVADRVDAVDVFCETLAFTPEQTRRIFTSARAHDLAVKIHAEQLSNLGGAALAAGMDALSADHLEYLDEAGARALADHGTVAVLLPAAAYFMRETRRPPIDLLRAYSVPMAVSTDANPGTSPCFSLLTAMNMACVLLDLTPEEALAGVTVHAARALGAADRLGTVAPGKDADLALWDVADPAELSYYVGYSPCTTVIKHGEVHPCT